ncbi:hypothetical protein UO65_3616 [Actinokineospora spheciospongiae]|uniref:Uncharacterized protein n=1 Tax=Actinokineospora spheciospongiae TaxID=909613 RepID=W7IJK5_9PSEU|nr:hypothetical protein [Actinokineospora spheciospongiae]EWC61045.1 hypothetical protein UO65_3616 [Actinokineospora spheciospongiae]
MTSTTAPARGPDPTTPEACPAPGTDLPAAHRFESTSEARPACALPTGRG